MNAATRPPKPKSPPFLGLPRIPAMAKLQARQQWVAWGYSWNENRQKWDKPPLNPHTMTLASHSRPETWGSYEEALACVQQHGLAGLGFVLGAEDGLTGIDLDGCRDKTTATLEPWAADLVALAETYAEVSPSGEGVRLFALGKVEKAIKLDQAGIEIYGRRRYLTVTGAHITGMPLAIQPAPRTLAALMSRVQAVKAEQATRREDAEKPGRSGSPFGFDHAGNDKGAFFRTVNARALERLDAWVPVLFGSAAIYQPGTGGYRVSSAALGRDLQEDLSITPIGSVDFGVHDLGCPREGRRTAIDLVMEHGGKSAPDAALWLCERLGINPASIGWRAAQDGPRTTAHRQRPAGSAPDGTAAEPLDLNDGVITQDGVARLFASRHAGRLRYCHHTGSWFEWTGTHWRKDERDLAFQFARELAREASDGADAKVLKEARKVTFAAGVERFAQGDKAFAVTTEAWDRNPYLLGTPGGTVDLRTGELRAAMPGDGITKLTAMTPAAVVECPRWLAFLGEATGGDTGLISFLQQWSGYALTGDTREHALVFVYGPGGNGKTVFLNALTGILNGYAAVASMDTFTATRSDRHPTELAMLRGARLVTASETEEGRAWAESRIKQMTGGDPISARLMRQDFFTYQPQFKLTIVGNHKPVLRNVDEAARRRFNLVPFIRKPPSPDRHLEETLKGEWPGILRWMIEGCLDWQANRLVRPEAVQAATAAYFDDQDLFRQWLDEECDADPGNDHRWETVSALFASWRAFAERSAEPPGSTKAFSERMRRAGFEPHRTPTARSFLGVRLRPMPSYHDG